MGKYLILPPKQFSGTPCPGLFFSKYIFFCECYYLCCDAFSSCFHLFKCSMSCLDAIVMCHIIFNLSYPEARAQRQK